MIIVKSFKYQIHVICLQRNKEKGEYETCSNEERASLTPFSIIIFKLIKFKTPSKNTKNNINIVLFFQILNIKN